MSANINPRRVLAKGQVVQIEDEEGAKEFKIYPFSNRQLLEIQEIAKEAQTSNDGSRGIDMMIKMCEFAQLKPNIPNEPPLTSEEIKDFPTPILLKLLKEITKLNGMQEMFDFQQKEEEGQTLPRSDSVPASSVNTLADLNKFPTKRLS